MKKFKIEKEIWNIIPELSVGVIVIELPSKPKELNESELNEISKILKNANNEARKYVLNETLSENKVIKEWRETYQKFPTKKGARCSIENLLKRVLHDNPVSTINPIVDITNYISLKYAFPIGAEDLEKFDNDLILGIMNGNELFSLIGEEENSSPLPGEIAYKDSYGVVCRCLNWRDSERTKIDDNTTKVFIAIELIDQTRINELEEALEELSLLMKKYLNGTTYTKSILTPDNNEITIN